MDLLRRLLPLLLAALLTSCYEVYDLKVDFKPVLCLNGLITAGQPIKIDVTHTWLYTDAAGEKDHKVSDAEISIYANEVLTDADYLPREGDRIKVVAVSPTYGSAEAEVVVPHSEPLKSTDWEATILTSMSDASDEYAMNASARFDLRVLITLRDAPDTENYYQMSYTPFTPKRPDDRPIYGSLFMGTFKYEAEPIFSEHIGSFEAISGSDSYGFTFFTDKRFSGETYTLHLLFENFYYYIRNQTFDESLLDVGLDISINTVSASYYNWSNYCWQSDDGLLGDVGESGLGDPIWGYSNVSTGAGVIAAQSSQIVTINFKDFLYPIFCAK